jgi:predicted nuclease with RNAse H fold
MFYCGIDVAKRKHAVGILDESGRQSVGHYQRCESILPGPAVK